MTRIFRKTQDITPQQWGHDRHHDRTAPSSMLQHPTRCALHQSTLVQDFTLAQFYGSNILAPEHSHTRKTRLVMKGWIWPHKPQVQLRAPQSNLHFMCNLVNFPAATGEHYFCFPYQISQMTGDISSTTHA